MERMVSLLVIGKGRVGPVGSWSLCPTSVHVWSQCRPVVWSPGASFTCSLKLITQQVLCPESGG